jgi:hypothetical protein
MIRCIPASVRHADAIIDQMTVSQFMFATLHPAYSIRREIRPGSLSIYWTMVQYRRDAIDGSLASPTHTDAIGR